MPGQRSIVWSDANDSRLLQAFCVVQDPKLSTEQAEKIAKIMNNGVTQQAIKHRITTLRKRGAPSCNTMNDTPRGRRPISHPLPNKSKTKTPQTPQSANKKRKLNKLDGDDSVDSEDQAENEEPVTPGSRSRASMRATPSKNYLDPADDSADEFAAKGKLVLSFDESHDEDNFKSDQESSAEEDDGDSFW